MIHLALTIAAGIFLVILLLPFIIFGVSTLGRIAYVIFGGGYILLGAMWESLTKKYPWIMPRLKQFDKFVQKLLA